MIKYHDLASDCSHIFYAGAVRGDDAGTFTHYDISESARRGMRAGPQSIFGHALVEAALVALLLIGSCALFLLVFDSYF